MRATALLLIAVLGPAVVAAQKPVRRTAAKAAASVPPISYVCPMPQDAEVVEDKPGKCRKCGMTLVPVRLESVWTCPVHPLVAESKPGTCPIDGRDLVPVTMTLSWTCPGSDTQSLDPGTCPDGTPMTRKLSPRAHGNHNPQHGGQFFMAADNWHHLEGAFLPSGVFRLYLYDDFTRPLPLAKVRGVTARVITKQTFDPITKTTKEITSFPLVRAGRSLEARVGRIPFPAQMSAKVRFEPDKPENLFDFTFEAYSKEPASPPRTIMTPADMAAASMPPMTPPPATTPPAGESPAPVPAVDPALVPLPIPDTVPEIVAQLRVRNDQIRAIIDRGAFASVYVPAFQAKDLALALDEQQAALPPDKRRIAEPAIAKLVRAAYLLDAFGDIGNRQQIVDAYTRFAAAVDEIESLFPRR